MSNKNSRPLPHLNFVVPGVYHEIDMTKAVKGLKGQADVRDWLSRFRPIVEDIPRWKTGPGLIAAAVPERLLFVQVGPNETGLDYGNLVDLCDVVPEEDRNAYINRLNLMIDTIALHISQVGFEEFVRQPMTQLTLARMNDKVHNFDHIEEAHGRPTLLEIVRHELGLTPVWPLRSVSSVEAKLSTGEKGEE